MDLGRLYEELEGNGERDRGKPGRTNVRYTNVGNVLPARKRAQTEYPGPRGHWKEPPTCRAVTSVDSCS
jgi:hypothetical protein